MGLKRVGIFGGTFDPVHRGHQALIQSAKKTLNLSRVYVVLSYQNPLKGKTCASSHHRYRMLQIATKHMRFVKLSRFEIKQRRRVYTVETLRYFRRRLSRDTQIFLLIGGDIAAEWRRWHHVREILRLAQVAVTRRPAGKGGKVAFKKRSKNMIYFDMPCTPASGTQIRRLALQKKFIPQVSRDVGHYIQQHDLYKHR